ncbi:MAG: sugar ABC transporter ATP-binding protein [Brevibacillus sp.]|nr:sugar ABC transporter ATP-binding protein [Brevibacillus sp.]
MEYVLRMKGITKSFNNVEVLKGVDFQLKPGEVHALLGENGAGKSTLMNILGGVLVPDEGQIELFGKRVRLSGPHVSKSLGISFIHQELNVVSDLRVYENMFLGAELTDRFGFLRVDEMCRRAYDVLSKLGISLDPKAYVRELDASFRQIVEIARALLEEARIIIMDEPTTSLTDHEIDNLMALIRTLKSSGVSIIYISHKLKEVFSICDRYTVLRDGRLAGTGEIADTDEEQITRMMVGKSVADINYYRPRPLGAPLLSVTQLSCAPFFRNVSFTLHEGEILGFTGLAGDGRTELFECIFGYRRAAGGEISVYGRPVRIAHPQDALKAGIGFVPKNRKENAIIKDMSVLQNMSLTALKQYRRHLLIDDRRERAMYWSYKERLAIKAADPHTPIVSLSGGNQQKVVLAKWLEVNANILIFDNPTQGIDVGAKSEIYHLIMQLAAQGKAIVILSSEVPEILKLCDRVFVMHQGEITGCLERSQADEEQIMLYAIGVKREGQVPC